MKIVLITDDFYPKLGGISNVLFNLYNHFLNTKHKLIIFNPFYESKNAFKVIKLRKYKIRDLKNIIMKNNYQTEIEVDGGVNVDNVADVVHAGADIVVMGSAFYNSPDYSETVRKVRERCGG